MNFLENQEKKILDKWPVLWLSVKDWALKNENVLPFINSLEEKTSFV